jgi:hypothetical protein
MNKDLRSRWRRSLTRILLAVTLSMTTGEFIEVQKLSLDELRTRFGLPTSCEPAVTAMNTDPAANQMTVAIECRSKPASPAVRPAPGERRQPRPAGKGS